MLTEIFHQLYRHIVLGVAILFLACGLLFTFSFPPFQVADEDLHWVNANQWSEEILAKLSGRGPMICSAGAVLPYAFDIDRLKSNYTTKPLQGEISRTTSIAPGCHGRPILSVGSIFSYPGVALARLLVSNENNDGLKALHSFSLSRLMQGSLIFLVLLRMWLKLGSSNRWTTPGVLSLSIFCLSPMFINQSFGVTYDMVTLLFVLCVASCIIFKRESTWLDVLLLTTSGMAACSTKPVFIPVGLAALSILALSSGDDMELPNTSAPPIRSRLDPLNWAVLSASAALIITVGFAITVFDYSHIRIFFKDHPNIDPAYNKNFLLQDPRRAFAIIWNSVIGFLHLPIVASPLGWLNVQIHPESVRRWTSMVWGAIFIDLALACCNVYRTRASNRKYYFSLVRAMVGAIGAIISAAALCFATAIAMYIRWTPKDSLGVAGLQPRYFLPVLLLCVAALFCLTNISRLTLTQNGNECSPLPRVLRATIIVLATLVVMAVGLPYLVAINTDVVARFG